MWRPEYVGGHEISYCCCGWVTRAGNAIRDLFNQPVDYFALQTACDKFDMRLNALDNAQSIVELKIAKDLLDGDIEAAANFRNISQEPRLMAARLLHNQQLQGGSVDGGASVRDSVAAVSAKLPKIQLPHFSGDVKQWISFWEQFEVVSHESELPDITKFTYLRYLLKGGAKLSIQGLALANANYTVAIDILKKRFGRTERIVFSHIEELLNISVPKQPRVSVLWELNDKLQAHVRSLYSPQRVLVAELLMCNREDRLPNRPIQVYTNRSNLTYLNTS